MSNLYTTGQIAEILKERPMRVEYIVRRECLKPVDRVGLIRLFSGDQLLAIKEKLFAMRVQRSTL